MRLRIASLCPLLASLILSVQSLHAADWNFSTVSDTDRANLNADTANWTFEQSNNRWKNAVAIDSSPLMANGVELEFAKGLLFSAPAADNLRVDAKKGSLTLNNKGARITISGLKAGDVVSIEGGSSSSSTPRNLVASNLSVTSGFEPSTSRTVSSGTVKDDGDVVINSTGGFYVYSISAGEGGDTPVTRTDHSAGYSRSENQMFMTMADRSVKIYNTGSLSDVGFDPATGTVDVTGTGGEWTDSYASGVRNVNFVRRSHPVSDGEIINGGVEITEAKPWFESVYAKWELLEGADSYNVYVKGGGNDGFTRVDRELVRNYFSYGRVDIPGLAEGIYTIKVVPVSGGTELTDRSSEVRGLAVRAHDRSGFAFFGHDGGIGAYDNSGRLKDGARVLYVTAGTAKTVSLPVKMSDKDGDGTLCTGLQKIIEAYQKGKETRPLAIRLLGMVEAGDMDALGSSAEGLQVKGKNAYSPLNMTIEGIGDDACIRGFGVLVRNASSVELRNFAVMLCMDDCLSFDTANSHCWVHNMDFFYGNTGSDSDQAKGDGTVDLKGHSRYMTIAYNRFWDCGKTSLCGMKSESAEDYVDYHHNWFDHSDSRNPRVRTMTVHVWNNFYDGVSKYGVGATMGSSIFVERNFYLDTRDPMLISRQGTDAKGSGTFSGEDGGMIKSFGNVYAEKGKSSNYTVITQTDSPTSFDCFRASRRDETVPDTYRTLAGGFTYNNFDTDPAVMYEYSPLEAVDVPASVTGHFGAGRLSHGSFTFDLSYPGAETDYSVNGALKQALKDYKPSPFAIF